MLLPAFQRASSFTSFMQSECIVHYAGHIIIYAFASIRLTDLCLALGQEEPNRNTFNSINASKEAKAWATTWMDRRTDRQTGGPTVTGKR